jgi:hypothetical protein
MGNAVRVWLDEDMGEAVRVWLDEDMGEGMGEAGRVGWAKPDAFGWTKTWARVDTKYETNLWHTTWARCTNSWHTAYTKASSPRTFWELNRKFLREQAIGM